MGPGRGGGLAAKDTQASRFLLALGSVVSGVVVGGAVVGGGVGVVIVVVLSVFLDLLSDLLLDLLLLVVLLVLLSLLGEVGMRSGRMPFPRGGGALRKVRARCLPSARPRWEAGLKEKDSLAS
jgi:hypothetical protein